MLKHYGGVNHTDSTCHVFFGQSFIIWIGDVVSIGAHGKLKNFQSDPPQMRARL